MTINEEGFFSSDLESLRKELIKKHSNYFNLCSKLNNYAQKHKYLYKCSENDKLKLTAICLFIKILNGYQGCILLIQHLLPDEATALSRTLCEPLYLIRIFFLEPEFFQEYLKYDEIERQRIINTAENNRHKVFDNVRKYATQQIKDEINKRLDGFYKSQFRAEHLAVRAKMKLHYDTMFRMTSPDVHSPPRTILRYIRFDDQGHITGYDWGPSERNCKRIMVFTSDVLIKALAFMDEMCAAPSCDEFNTIIDEWKQLNFSTK